MRFYIYQIDELQKIHGSYGRLLRLIINNRIEFMTLTKSGYGPIKNFYLRNSFEGAV